MSTDVTEGSLVGQRLGKYELLALIAVGGTAEIYLARISGASGFEKYLVVKCLLDHLADDEEFVRMFLDEARVSAQLDHSNVVQTLELGQSGGRYFLVMEYLAGMSLAQMARKTQERRVNGGLIDTNIVLGLASQTCNGLHYAHTKTVQGKPLNLVHRDISPQNLVVSYEGVLKIVDFGIAKSDIRDSQTRAGTIKGKFAYMSPEQCLAKTVDFRTDIFALGTLCHELLTGRRLFKRQSTYDTYQAIVSGVVPKPSDINPNLDRRVDPVIMKALEYEPGNRYQSTQDFGEAILRLLHERQGTASHQYVSRFFEDHFSMEMEAHTKQMREFITGKKKIVRDTTWDQCIESNELSPRTSSAPVVSPENSSYTNIETTNPQNSIDAFDDDDDDDLEEMEEGGATRIELDPRSHMENLASGNSAKRQSNSVVSTDDGWDDEIPTQIGSLPGDVPGPTPREPVGAYTQGLRTGGKPHRSPSVPAGNHSNNRSPSAPYIDVPTSTSPIKNRISNVEQALEAAKKSKPAFMTPPPNTPDPIGVAGLSSEFVNPPQTINVDSLSAAEKVSSSMGMASRSMSPGGAMPKAVTPGGVMPGAAVNVGGVMPGAANGAVMPGGVMPGGVMPGAANGGVMPGGVMPGGVMPGGVMPGAVNGGGVMPGAMNPGAKMTLMGHPTASAVNPAVNPAVNYGGQQVPGAAPHYPSYVGSSLPIAAQHSGAVVHPAQSYNNGTSTEPDASANPSPYTNYPAVNKKKTKKRQPIWMHGIAFFVFLGLGYGIAVVIKSVL